MGGPFSSLFEELQKVDICLTGAHCVRSALYMYMGGQDIQYIISTVGSLGLDKESKGLLTSNFQFMICPCRILSIQT